MIAPLQRLLAPCGARRPARGRARRWRIALLIAIGFAVRPAFVSAQIDPSHDWRTLQTQHFYIHFTPPIEGLARRIAADAERAYGQLSRELHPPRGMIDVVISDDVDLSNGSATPFPTNRIVIFANPPVSETALRYTDDWAQLVITHELTHIFHLDRSRGIWALGQHVFGRAQLLFPNFYDPAWLTEGLAVYEESHLTGAGRIQGSEHRMIARAAAVDHHFPALGTLSLAQGRFPFGESAYAFGSLFVDYLARTQGESRIRDFVEKSSAELIPYLINVPSKAAFGESFSTAWRAFSDSVARSIRVAPAEPLAGWRQLTDDGVYVFAPRWLSDSAVVYSGTPGRAVFGAYRVDATGKRTRMGRRNSRSANVPLADGSLLFSQLDFTNPYQERSDLWIQRRGGGEHQLTHGARLTAPDARADGAIVATQIIPGGTRLVRVSKDGKRITPITGGGYDEQWTEPRWSHSGDRIAASRWRRGNIAQIVVIDTTGQVLHVVSSGSSIEATPSWLPNDAGIMYSSDRTGSAQVYVEQFGDPRTFEPSRTVVVSDAVTGVFEPSVAPRGDRLAAIQFRGDGYHLGMAPCCDALFARDTVATYLDTLPSPTTAPLLVDSGRVTRYSPWRTFIPRYWLPTIDQGIDGGYRIGIMTSGFDVIGRHVMTAQLDVPTNNTGLTGNLSYQYSGLGLPIIQVDASQDWQSLGGIFTRDAQQKLIGEVRRRTLGADVLATWIHQRVRNALTLTAGVGVEHRTDISVPDGLLPLVDSGVVFGSPTFPSLIAAAGYANYLRPPFSISPEDGVQLNATVRDRLASGRTGKGPQTVSVVGTAALFKALALPGYAHHVIALRGAAGWADENASGYFSVGGISGSTFEIIPGYTIGEDRKTFGVRGFAPGTLIGTRAFAGSAEYRLPLFLTGRSPGALPFFLDRSSVTVFADYGTAWCPTAVVGREVCNRAAQTEHVDIASAGAELNLNLGVLSWDSPYRFRLGLAVPTQNGDRFGQRSVQFYVTAGVSF